MLGQKILRLVAVVVLFQQGVDATKCYCGVTRTDRNAPCACNTGGTAGCCENDMVCGGVLGCCNGNCLMAGGWLKHCGCCLPMCYCAPVACFPEGEAGRKCFGYTAMTGGFLCHAAAATGAALGLTYALRGCRKQGESIAPPAIDEVHTIAETEENEAVVETAEDAIEAQEVARLTGSEESAEEETRSHCEAYGFIYTITASVTVLAVAALVVLMRRRRSRYGGYAEVKASNFE